MNLKITTDKPVVTTYHIKVGSLWVSPMEPEGEVYILLWNYDVDLWCAYGMKSDNTTDCSVWRSRARTAREAVEGLIPAPPLTIRWE